MEVWDSKAETREVKSRFQSSFKSHNKFSGGKAENYLKYFLKSLVNIKLIWVGSPAI